MWSAKLLVVRVFVEVGFFRVEIVFGDEVLVGALAQIIGLLLFFCRVGDGLRAAVDD